MSEMIERVAEAIMRVETDDKISDYYKWARAAIEAMREPTEVMADTCDLYEYYQGYELDPVTAWEIMIEVALIPPETSS